MTCTGRSLDQFIDEEDFIDKFHIMPYFEKHTPSEECWCKPIMETDSAESRLQIWRHAIKH